MQGRAGGRRTRLLPLLAPVAVCALVAAPVSTRSAASRAAAATVVGRSPAGKIKHVVWIMQENRSFDEVLGEWCRRRTPKCDGYVGPVHLSDGTVAQMTQSPDVINPDAPHNVGSQIRAIDGGKMDGWGALSPVCHSPGNNECLTYYVPSQIPSLTSLATSYAVSDRTFSAEDSPSWGGHMWAATPTQDGFTGDIPYFAYANGWGCDANADADWTSPNGVRSAQPSCIPAPTGLLDPAKYPYRGAYRSTVVPSVPTIFDRLDRAKLPWRIYSTVYAWSVCPTFAECLYGPQHNNSVSTQQVLADAAHGTLPAYSVLLPDGGNGTGQHPPSSMLVGDNWIGRVVGALQASPDWSSTAIFITYDDCGCFYDHVPPGLNPDGTQQGIRVPMVIVSPYAKAGAVDSVPASFASVLHFTEEALGLAPIDTNDAKAYDYSGVFDFAVKPTAPRVWPRAKPVPAATQHLVASLPKDDNDPT